MTSSHLMSDFEIALALALRCDKFIIYNLLFKIYNFRSVALRQNFKFKISNLHFPISFSKSYSDFESGHDSTVNCVALALHCDKFQISILQ
jgi:hypothetical protein